MRLKTLTVVLFPAATGDVYADDYTEDDGDPVMDMHPNARATGVPRCWTPDIAAKLTSTVTNTARRITVINTGQSVPQVSCWSRVKRCIPAST